MQFRFCFLVLVSLILISCGGKDASDELDSDADGVVDSLDAFPNNPNETLDSDGDGIGDNSDSSPFGTDGTTSSNGSVLSLPSVPFGYSEIELPEHYTTNFFPETFAFQRAAVELDNEPANNVVTDEGATLGRVLFYDKKLSANGTKSCASCHQQVFGFADRNRLSVGFEGGLTARHSMALANNRFYLSGKYFWGERADSLEEQVLMPIQDEVEMGLTLAELEQVVAAQSYYPSLFIAAFGDANVSSERIADALAQFQRSMVNTQSKYDIARLEHLSLGETDPIDDFPGFSQSENAGKRLFFLPQPVVDTEGRSLGDRVSCAGCHITEAFVGTVAPPGALRDMTDATINGLDDGSESDYDPGIGGHTGVASDEGKFKVPSLANIAIRPPYMHDGRFSTLEQVIDHYSSGIKAHANLNRPLLGSNGLPVRFNFSSAETAQLVDFLETLTDQNLLTNEMWSNPFTEN